MLPQAGFPGEAGAAVTKVAAAGMPIKARVSCFWHNLQLAECWGRLVSAECRGRFTGSIGSRGCGADSNFGAGGGGGGGGTGNVGLSGEVFVAEA